MNQLEIEKASDSIDVASYHEQASMATTIEAHTRRFRPQPKFNTAGLKICLRCEEIIPSLRAAIPEVTHCLECQKEKESSSLQRRQHKVN